MRLEDRVKNYVDSFPNFPEDSLWVCGEELLGMWVMGNNYRVKGGYGSYPHGYMARMSALFPDKYNVLHLFAGWLPESPDYKRVDINPERADVLCNAEELSSANFNGFVPDIIYADPPYSVEDCEHYGTIMIKRNTVVNECAKIMPVGAHLVWLDQVLPMYRKVEFKVVGRIGMVKSTNHRFRVITIFERI